MTCTISLRVSGLGKRTRRGREAWAFPDYAERVLSASGWTLVGRLGLDSVYPCVRMAPPPGLEGCKNPVILAEVPERGRIVEAMRAAHVARLPFDGELDGWPMTYAPREVRLFDEMIMSVGAEDRHQMYAFVDPATFRVGPRGLWSVGWVWDLGDDDAPREISDESNIVGGHPASQLLLRT